MSVFLNVVVNGKKHSVQVGWKPILLGRSNKCNVKFSDPLLSSKHCELTLSKEGKVVITDLNSTNGSFVNDVKIISSHLYIGDTLRIGSIEITIDGSRLKPSERKPLTRKTEVGRTKFMDLKVNQKTHAAYRADLSMEEEEEDFDTKVVDLEEQRQLIEKRKQMLKNRAPMKAHKKKKKKEQIQRERDEQPDVLTKILKIFGKD